MSSKGIKVRVYFWVAAAFLWCAVSGAERLGFTPLFNGTTLAGWQVQGTAAWRVESGEIVGSVKSGGAGGWLVLDRAYEDFILEFSVRCTNCESGILLRGAPLKDHMSRLYASLSGAAAGALSTITLNAQGQVVERKSVPTPTARHGAVASGAAEGVCPPIPCEGINDPQAGPLRWPPESPVRISERSNGWKQVRITMRGAVAGSSERRRYGKVALHIAGPAGAEARFKDISLLDLTRRITVPSTDVTGAGFRKQQLTDFFYAEGIAAGDLNRDGVPDVVVGPLYYLGPDYKVAREIYPPETINPSGSGEHGNYTNCFLSYVYDFNGDGWPDVLMVMGFGPSPDFSGHLFINPQGGSCHWDNYDVLPSITAETTQLVDIDGDGRPELVMSQDDQIGYAKADWSDSTKRWTFHAVSQKGDWAPHGFGVGDVNGDGRIDILQGGGWWEQPPKGTNGLWKFYPVQFGSAPEFFLRGGADMFLYDVNGDGLPDVITSLNAHGPGLAWYEQKRDGQRVISWKQHLIMGNPAESSGSREKWEETDKAVAFTELHALALADMDGDGLKDIITGKRWWSHGYIPEENEVDSPAVLYWFKLVRKPGGEVEFVPHLIHNDSGVGTQIVAADMNGDGMPDVLTTARKGTFIFFNELKKAARK
jgi:hypothetical protein